MKHARDSASAESEEESTVTLKQGSVRVPFTALDGLMDLLAEMVMLRNGLSEVVSRGRKLKPSDDDFVPRSAEAWADVRLAQEALGRNLDFVQDRITHLRMVPLSTLFGSLKHSLPTHP